jgi:hypothetical protein
MKQYNEDELGYFGISEQKVLSQEEFEQKVEQEEAGKPWSTDDAQYNKRRRSGLQKNNPPDAADIPNNTATAPIIDSALFAQLLNVKPGTSLQTIADYWTNGILVPANTTFEVLTAPKKIRKVNNTYPESNMDVSYIVHGKVLLNTGKLLEFRMSLSNCILPTLPTCTRQDDELKW